MRITISGKPGAGKTTVAKLLAERLGLKYIEIGKIAQHIALRHGMPIGELMEKAKKDKSIDEEIDSFQKNLGKKEDNFIVDGRISHHFIPNAIHIFLDIDITEAAQRIFNKPREPDEPPYTSIEEVKKDIHRRMLTNKEQWQKYYNINYLDLTQYDIVLDTTGKTSEKIVEKIIEFVKAI